MSCDIPHFVIVLIAEAMPLVGAAILPHGALIFDGNPDSESEACKERHAKLPDIFKEKFKDLYSGCVAAGKFVSDLEPDVIILHTPHGLKLTESNLVYITEYSQGSAKWLENWDEFNVTLKTDAGMAADLVEHMKTCDVNVQGLVGHAGLVATSFSPMYLAWGEVIPAYFINKHANKEPKFLIVSHAKRPGRMNEEALNMGKSLATFIRDYLADYRVAMVISADLSHTYDPEYKDNPVYLPIPIVQDNIKPQDEAAKNFEKNIKCWIHSADISSNDSDATPHPSNHFWVPEQALPWLEEAAKLQPKALSCGLNGFSVLQGVLTHHHSNGGKITSTVRACQAPTYYGLLAATFSFA